MEKYIDYNIIPSFSSITLSWQPLRLFIRLLKLRHTILFLILFIDIDLRFLCKFFPRIRIISVIVKLTKNSRHTLKHFPFTVRLSYFGGYVSVSVSLKLEKPLISCKLYRLLQSIYSASRNNRYFSVTFKMFVLTLYYFKYQIFLGRKPYEWVIGEVEQNGKNGLQVED